MDERDRLTRGFEEHRKRLRGIAYRMLGSLSEADDAVQDAWLRASQAGTGDVENLSGWLTTIVARVCLNRLRARNVRREDPVGVHVPDLLVYTETGSGPEDEAVLADSISLALLVVLETLAPAERLAFVLHDLFELPFAEIAAMLDRTPAAARQLASRARRRVRGADVSTRDHDRSRQREVVDAFFAAARSGDLDALLAVLDPDVVLRVDAAPRWTAASMRLQGADAVAAQTTRGLASALARPGTRLRHATVNGAAGVIVIVDDVPTTVMGFTIGEHGITAIDAIADPDRVTDVVRETRGRMASDMATPS